MDCLNCFTPPRPLSNSSYHRRLRLSHLNTARDPFIYNVREPPYTNRPPTPYPHQERFTGELLTPRRAYTRNHKRYGSRRTVNDVTVAQQWRLKPIPVEAKHISVSEGTRSLPRRRRSVSFQDQWGAQLQPKIAAQNDRISNRPALIRKSVAFQERDPELQKRIEDQNDRIRRRLTPPKLPRSIPSYPYADDLLISFSDLRLGSRYKR